MWAKPIVRKELMVSVLAVALGIKAIEQEYKIQVVSAQALIASLARANLENRLEERLKLYCQAKRLIVDEIGYIPIDRAVLLCDGEIIESSNPTMEASSEGGDVSPGSTMNLEQLEREAIVRALQVTRGVQKEAAQLLGISPRVLNYKIQILNIDWKVYRNSVA